MKIDRYTRCKLIEYALSDLHLKVDFKDISDNDTLEYIIAKKIIERSHYCVFGQLPSYGITHDNSFNRLIHWCLKELQGNSNLQLKNNESSEIKKLLGMFKLYSVGISDNYNNIVLSESRDFELLNYCKLFIDMKKSHQNKKATLEDNEIASDSFLFEMVIKQAATDLFGKENISRKLSNTSGIGQLLIADTVIKHNDKCIILDAKFYNNQPLSTENGRTVYKFQNNRYQMCSYITQLKFNTFTDLDVQDVVGVIIHAIDGTEDYNYTLVDNHMNIGDNIILLEFVDIKQSSENIINQIKLIINKYID